MKVKFIDTFDDKHKKGSIVEVDAIKYDPSFEGNYKVRIVGEWKRPRWLALTWFTKWRTY